MSKNKLNPIQELKIKYKRKKAIKCLSLAHIGALALFSYIYYKFSYNGICLIIGVINSIIALAHLTVVKIKINKTLKEVLSHKLACSK